MLKFTHGKYVQILFGANVFSFCTISRSKSEVNIEMAKLLRKDESGVLENKRPTAHAHSTQEAT